MNKSWNLNKESVGYTWRDHDIYMKRALDLQENIMRSIWRE